MAEGEVCDFDCMGTNLISEKGISLWYTAFNLGFYSLFGFHISVQDFNHAGLNTANFLWD